MKLLSEIKSNKVMLCLAGNLCDPEVTYEKVEIKGPFQKIYLDYLDESALNGVDAAAEETVALIRSYPDVTFVLNGYSAGGVIALGAASKDPEAIAGLVLSNTGPCSIGHGNPNFANELKENFDNEEYVRSFLSSCFASAIPAETEDRLWKFTRSKTAEAGYMISKTLREVDYRQALNQYRNPIIIIHGVKDTRRKMNSVEMMQECMPQSEVELLETGHTSMYEDPEGYNTALNHFLNRLK